ncbi:uncharacterized protein LOC115781342 [Archocentrus centrarchus]|uniref:uncharacterized protein LOC115781342 n=1 Tax=Archocentrus centrarchus TaxID=63155 RepID=UPI0011E9CB92|nr:uncharacterized protein LOC115781342 [Archocentrus centrarchus]
MVQGGISHGASQFLEYRSSKSKERQSFNYGPRGRHRAKERKHIQINIGLMVPSGTDLKPLKGKTVPLFVDPEVGVPEVLQQAVKKMRRFNKDIEEGQYILLYPDCSEVVHVPGSERPFKLADYKKELGGPYSRITFFICLETHFKGADDTSDSDSEIVITSRSRAEFNQADTVFEPQKQSTPKDKIEMHITLPDIVANPSRPIDHKRVSRFNISRANVWEGAVRGFRRSSYSENCDMLVRFTNDAGVYEEGIEAGGPRREFLTLLIKYLKDRPIFDGPEGHRFVVYNANRVRYDEYFLAGKMIAVSVVHGGPGPRVLSEDLVQYLAGQPSFKPTVNLITDEEIGKALREVGIT